MQKNSKKLNLPFMRKEPLIFSWIRLLISFAILVLLALLYWSSTLVEQDLITIKAELKQLTTRLDQASFKSQDNTEAKHALKRPYIDSSLPNLLEPDPFYEKTLPKMLGKGFTPSGVRKLATVSKPDNLHPMSNWGKVNSWLSLCSISLARSQFGFYESYCPFGAIKIEKRAVANSIDIEYWVHLRENVFWQPLKQKWFTDQIQLSPHFLKKHPVTAKDYKLFYDIIKNPFVAGPKAQTFREFFSDIVSVETIDDLTFVIRWKTHPITQADGKVEYKVKYLANSLVMAFQPIASFLYLYYPDGKKIVEEDQDPKTYQTNSTFAQHFNEHWAKNIIPSSGPMQFEGMNDQGIKFSRNPDHFEPLDCLVDAMDVEFKQTNENIWQSFKQGSLDNYPLQPSQRSEFENFKKSAPYLDQEKKGLKINDLQYISRLFAYIGWNQARPLFKSKKIRQALTYAIDRKRIIDQILGGMGVEMSSPFFPYSTSYDSSIAPYPYSIEKAKRLLEEEGFFDLDGDGILEKRIESGILKFEFSLIYYVKNPTTKAIVEYVAATLKEIGVKCNLRGVDVADLSAIFDDKDFDAYTLMWSLGSPPEDLRQLWHSSSASEKGSSNAIGFNNKEVDQIIDQLTYEYDPVKRTQLYHKFDAIFYEEAPYTLLYTPKISFLYRNYLENVFLPVDRQDLIPGAIVAEPDSSIFWIKKVGT